MGLLVVELAPGIPPLPPLSLRVPQGKVSSAPKCYSSVPAGGAAETVHGEAV